MDVFIFAESDTVL